MVLWLDVVVLHKLDQASALRQSQEYTYALRGQNLLAVLGLYDGWFCLSSEFG